MVKHHGLIIIDVAVWILTFKQDPTSLEHELIIKCCCVVPIPELSHYRRGLSGISELEGLFPILRYQYIQAYLLDRKQIIIFTEECGYCCALPCDPYSKS